MSTTSATSEAAPARAASETRSRSNGSPIDVPSKEHKMHVQDSEERKSPIDDTLTPGTRVMARGGYQAGLFGTVRTVERHPARYDDEGVMVLPAQSVVTVDFDHRATGIAFTGIDGGEPLPLSPTVPPIECAPWCSDSDGHPNHLYRSDQCCESRHINVRPLTEVSGGPRHGRFETYSVSARRLIGRDDQVVFWLREIDVEQTLSAAEARALAKALLAAADIAEGVTR